MKSPWVLQRRDERDHERGAAHETSEKLRELRHEREATDSEVRHLVRLLDGALQDLREERRNAREVLEMVNRARAESVSATIALADGFSDRLRTAFDQVLQLRRDGFQPAPVPVWTPEQLAGAQPPEPVPAETPETGSWVQVMDAIQERAGDNPQLYTKVLEQAGVWRSQGITPREIARRIWEGWE